MNDSDAFDDVPLSGDKASNEWVPESRPLETFEDPTPDPRPREPQPREPQPRVPRSRMTTFEAFSLLFWTGLADWLIYRTDGFSGPALFLALVPLFFLFRRGQTDDDHSNALSYRVAKAICVALLYLTSIRLAFNGNGYVLVSGVLLTFALALSSSRAFPWALETAAMSCRSFVDGVRWIARHRLPSTKETNTTATTGVGTLAWLLPALATIVFGAIFVLANPDLWDFVSTRLDWVERNIKRSFR